MTDPVSPPATRKLEDLERDLTALKRRIEVVEAMFGTEPERGLRVTARADAASLLLARSFGRGGKSRRGC